MYRQDELLIEGHVFMATVQGSGTAMKLCPFPDYILNGEIPTIPGLTDSMTASVSSSAAAPITKKRLPPPRRKKNGMKTTNDGWRSFGNGEPCLMTVYLDDTDFTGISYNANYLKWMERARADAIGIEHLAALRKGTETTKGVGAAIYKLTMKFKRGANFGDRVVITTFAKLDSDYRVTFKHELRLWEKKKIITGGTTNSSNGETKEKNVTGNNQKIIVYPTKEEIGNMPLLVSAEISLIFLSEGGNGALVKLPASVLDMMQ